MNYYNTAHIIVMSFLFIFMPICGMEEKKPVIRRGKFITPYLQQKLETADDINKHIENTKTIISFLPKGRTERSFSAGIQYIINGLKKFNTIPDNLLNHLSVTCKFDQQLNDFHNLLKIPGEIDSHNINPIMVEIFQQKLKYNYQFDISPRELSSIISDTLEIIKILYTSISPDNTAPTSEQYYIKNNTPDLIKTYITKICDGHYTHCHGYDYDLIYFLITADIQLQALSYLDNATLKELLKSTIEPAVLKEINLFKKDIIETSYVDSNSIINDLKELIINTQTTNEKILQSLNDAINDVNRNKDTIDATYASKIASLSTHKQYMVDRDAKKETEAVIENEQNRDEEKKRLQPIIDTYLNKNVKDFIFTTNDIITDYETLRKFINPNPLTYTNITQLSYDDFVNKCNSAIAFLDEVINIQAHIKEKINTINNTIKRSTKRLYRQIKDDIDIIIKILFSVPTTEEAQKCQLYKNIIETLLETVEQTKIVCMFEIDANEKQFEYNLDLLKEDLQKCSQIDKHALNTADETIEEAKINNYYTKIISLTNKYNQKESLLSYTAEELSNDLTTLQMYHTLYLCNYPTYDTTFKNSHKLKNTKYHINFCIKNIKNISNEKLTLQQKINTIAPYHTFKEVIEYIIQQLQSTKELIPSDTTDIINQLLQKIPTIAWRNNKFDYIDFCLQLALLQSTLDDKNANQYFNDIITNITDGLAIAIDKVITCSMSEGQTGYSTCEEIIKTLKTETNKFENNQFVITMVNNLTQELLKNQNAIDEVYKKKAADAGLRQIEYDKNQKQQEETDRRAQEQLNPIIAKYGNDQFSSSIYNNHPILFDDNLDTDLISLESYKPDANTDLEWKKKYWKATNNLKQKIIEKRKTFQQEIGDTLKPFLGNTNSIPFELEKIIRTISTLQGWLPKTLCAPSQLKKEVTSNIKLLLNTIQHCNYTTLNLETLKDFSKIFTDKTNKMYINDQEHNEECLKIIDGFISSYIKTLINTDFNEKSFENINDFDLLQANTNQLGYAQQKLNSKKEFDNDNLNTCFLNACKMLDKIGKSIQANENNNTETKNNNNETSDESDESKIDKTNESDETNETDEASKINEKNKTGASETKANDIIYIDNTNQSWSYNPFPSLWSFITNFFSSLFSWRPW